METLIVPNKEEAADAPPPAAAPDAPSSSPKHEDKIDTQLITGQAPEKSVAAKVGNALVMLIVVPLMIVVVLVYLLVWVVPGFGYCYETWYMKKQRALHYPRSSGDSFIALESCGGRKIHVKQSDITVRGLTNIKHDKVYVVAFPGAGTSVAGTQYIVRDVTKVLDQHQDSEGNSTTSTSTCTLHLVEYEHIGYGYSNDHEDAEHHSSVDMSGKALVEQAHELLCKILNTEHQGGQASTHPPIIGWGQSYGGLVATLYQLTYPTLVSGLLLVDPEVTNIFSSSAPMGSMMNKAPGIYSVTSKFATAGAIRPIAALMPYSSGELKEAAAVMPAAYVSQAFSARHMANMAREFTGMKLACEQLHTAIKQQKTPFHTPLIVVTGGKFSQLYGGMTQEQTKKWWIESQSEYLRTSTNTQQITQERTHVQVCTDGETSGRLLKQIIQLIQNNGKVEAANTQQPHTAVTAGQVV